MAIAAILLGLADIVGWSFAIVWVMRSGASMPLALEEFSVSEADLNAAPAPIAAAMRANVLIVRGGLLNGSIGSGVILRIHDRSALILTNRHVASPQGTPDEQGVTVRYVDGTSVNGRVVWTGPEGLDAAMVLAESSSGAGVAAIAPAGSFHLGDDVFAIGNPRGLGWTHTKGAISQFREKSVNGSGQLRIIQTSTPLNPGNSGGGLYSASGQLIGINTWAADKTKSEGLGFAISYDSLQPLLPPLDRYLAPSTGGNP
jgi:serine protease Do